MISFFRFRSVSFAITCQFVFVFFNFLDYMFVSSLSAVRRNFDKWIKHDDTLWL